MRTNANTCITSHSLVASPEKALQPNYSEHMLVFLANLHAILYFSHHSNAAASNPRNVNLNPANSKDAAAQNPRNVQQNPRNNAAASNPRNVKPNPANINNAAGSNPQNVKLNPANIKDAAASNRRSVKRKPPANNNAAASNARNVKLNPADSNNAADSNPRNVQENPVNRNNAADSKPRNVQENPVNSNNAADSNPHNVQENPVNSNNAADSNPHNVQENPVNSKSYLSSTCSAITNATVTQGNAPVGTKFTYDGDNKRSMTVTPELFKVFPKENPFQTAPWETCAVVGNGGILANSSCGKEIDAASFVIRCNLPPLNNGHENDTGRKTSLVTANPSIFVEKYSALNEYRRPFLEDMQLYGDALVLLPAFSFRRNTAVCLRALYSLEDYSNNGPRPIIFNPTYLNSLAQFWREQGIQSLRLSTGIMMASLALELCKNVHLYGYWPFGKHPITHQQLTNHYYDNRPVNKRMHAMPDEIKALMNLHNKGVIHLHLENCAN
ncbi:alpha-2,8-sialyltransferase 8F [Silurus meridionalis]|nr:alpha-2,8-sialyltransferase 8F [Silurus meridionalis]